MAIDRRSEGPICTCSHPQGWHEALDGGALERDGITARIGPCGHRCGCEAFARRRRGGAPSLRLNPTAFDVAAELPPEHVLALAFDHLAQAATAVAAALRYKARHAPAESTHPASKSSRDEEDPPKPNGHAFAPVGFTADAPAMSTWGGAVAVKDPAKTALNAGERAILAAVAQHPRITRPQLTIATALKKSTRDRYLYRLLRAGFVTEEGGRFGATTEGTRELGPAAPSVPTGAGLRAAWEARLGAGEAAIFRAACARYPQAITIEELTLVTGLKKSTRDRYLFRLSAAHLVARDKGSVTAAQWLFQGKGGSDG